MKKEYLFIRALSLTVILILVASLAVFSAFSWYDRTARPNETGRLLNYTQTGKVNKTQDVSVITYSGTLENGEVTYSETALSGAVSVKAGQVNYFKSVVTNGDVGDALVSLYLKEFTYNSGMGQIINIGLVNPEKTYKEYQGDASGSDYVISTLCLEDNIFVESNGEVVVEWFVKPSASYTGDAALDIGKMFIAYN